ncbi:MAG: response regulator transcription factor [Hungatella sp.]|nr:response regulator transcription factor [Hungatella sp.]
MEIKVIVVDNSPELKERLVSILSGLEGVMVCKSFDDAVAAMQYVEENQIDLVFSDVVMPEISGITLASMIYERDEHPEVVLLSGIPGFSLEAWKIRAFGFIIKPYTRAQIVDMVKKYRQAAKEGLLERDVVHQGER